MGKKELVSHSRNWLAGRVITLTERLEQAEAGCNEYRRAVAAHNQKQDAVPVLACRPETAPEGLRFLATWFDAVYGDAGTGEDIVQIDLRRWADHIASLTGQLAAANQAREKAELRASNQESIAAIETQVRKRAEAERNRSYKERARLRVKNSTLKAQRDALQTQLEAWHTTFGTTQLTHAAADRDRMVRRILEQATEGETP